MFDLMVTFWKYLLRSILDQLTGLGKVDVYMYCLVFCNCLLHSGKNSRVIRDIIIHK